MSTASLSMDSSIFAVVLGADRDGLDEAASKAILELRFTAEQVAEMEELLDRNNRGVITHTEREKMESYRRVGNHLALWQSKARLSLAKRK